MIFNSVQFAFFFTAVLGLYWLLDHRRQNRMLLAASYVFYGSWDWRFLSLIFASTVFDYWAGLRIGRAEGRREKKTFMIASVAVNLGFLGFFKYFNFFSENFAVLLNHAGLHASAPLLKIILPVGISFYTFQSMSYTIGIYRGELKPTRDFLDFALYVAFFPQLMAGPIERARDLMPQVLKPRPPIDYEGFRQGSYLILWGLVQKVIVADRLSVFVDQTFSSAAPYSGAKVLFAVYAFAFQIYGDFAGYSNMARGIAKLLGFDFMVNFDFPYLAKNPREFWQRWHISLSTWLRDYLYIPLGGSRGGTAETCRNLMIAMFLGGLWHGAAWTFVAWGVYHGLILVVHRLWGPKVRLGGFVSQVVTFHAVCLGWLFFRADSMRQAWAMLAAVFTRFDPAGLGLGALLANGFLVAALLAYEYPKHAGRTEFCPLRLPALPRWILYVCVFHLSAILIMKGARQFIYFQF